MVNVKIVATNVKPVPALLKTVLFVPKTESIIQIVTVQLVISMMVLLLPVSDVLTDVKLVLLVILVLLVPKEE